MAPVAQKLRARPAPPPPPTPPHPKAQQSGFCDLGAPLCRIDTSPVIRDACFYVLIAVILCFGLLDGRMELYESCSLVAVYFMYVGVIAKRMRDAHVVTEQARKMTRDGEEEQEGERGEEDAGEKGGGADPFQPRTPTISLSNRVQNADTSPVYFYGDFSDGSEGSTRGHDATDTATTTSYHVLHRFVALIRWVYKSTIPFPPAANSDSEPPPTEVFVKLLPLEAGRTIPSSATPPAPAAPWRVWCGLVVSLAYVAVLSNLALVVAEDAAIALGLSRVVASATLLAAGAQVPDTLGSIAMSKQVRGG